jgi:nucleotide-binding universal stress UspA family protein
MTGLDVQMTRETFRDRDNGGAPIRVSRESLHVLAATDGRPQADYALLAARRLDAEGTLGILTVVQRSLADVESDHDMDEREKFALRRRVDWQLRRVLGNDAKTVIDVRSGDTPVVLASAAVSGDSLLVVGIGRPKVCDRLLGDESTLRLVRAARTPVLAVAPGCALPAHSVLIAVDFSATSFAAARLALRLAAPGANVLLVHVAPRRGEITWGSGASGFRGDADLALEHWIHRLRPGFIGTMLPIVLHGDPATELLAIAAHRACDLVAVGAHGHGPADRGDIGSVTARLVRCAHQSVVVVPRCDDVLARVVVRSRHAAVQGFLTQNQRPDDAPPLR